jgi:hypothetical protein
MSNKHREPRGWPLAPSDPRDIFDILEDVVENSKLEALSSLSSSVKNTVRQERFNKLVIPKEALEDQATPKRAKSKASTPKNAKHAPAKSKNTRKAG